MTEPTRLHLAWEVFDSTLDPRIPGIYTIPGNPPVNLFRDNNGTRFGIRIPIEADLVVEPTGLTSVQSEVVTLEDEKHLQVSTTQQALFSNFLAISQVIADQIQLAGEQPVKAVQKSLSDFKEILRSSLRLSEEAQIGLWGELWVLKQLISESEIGASLAVNAWVGPHRQAHDFRLNREELEVKTTRGDRRIHMINRLDQLDASAGNSLHLISIQIVRPGGNPGRSLAESVGQVRLLLGDDAKARETFEHCLEDQKYYDEDAYAYTTRYQLKDDPKLITIGDDFPKINRDHLDTTLGQHSHRVADVQYRLDVEGIDTFSGSSLLKRAFVMGDR